MLTNAESWINVTKLNLDDLEKPDTILQRKVLSITSNPSKCFMKLELGIIPVKFVIMKKRLLFLQYILKENKESMMRKVFDALKQDSRKGDFIHLTNCDRETLNLNFTDFEIENMSKWCWKKILNKEVKKIAFSELLNENLTKEKTRDIHFDDLEISNYLKENERSSLSKLIFKIRSQTLNIKSWQPWNYSNNSCVKCEKTKETMSHFVTCVEYPTEIEHNWWDIKQNNTETQKEIARIVEKRFKIRQEILDSQQEGGQASNTGSNAPVDC